MSLKSHSKLPASNAHDADYDFDVAVVGAGPAGSSMALRLAQAGQRVCVIDASQFPREKVCGEGLMPHGVAALEDLGLAQLLKSQGQAFHGIRYVLPNGQNAQAQFPAPRSGPNRDRVTGLAIRRSILDNALVTALAENPKVDLKLGTKLCDLEVQPDAVQLTTSAATIRAKLLIGADGSRSRTRELLGLKVSTPRKPRFAIRAHFQHRENLFGADQKRFVEVFLGDKFELYMTPVQADVTGVIMTIEKHHLNMIQGKVEQAIRQALSETQRPALVELGRGLAMSKIQARGPLAKVPERCVGDRWVLIGDAAGALDPITGEGMSLALKTAKLAAPVLIEALEANDFSYRRLKAYSKLRSRAMRELAFMTYGVLLLSRSKMLANQMVKNMSKFPESFSKLLGVTAGTHHLTSLTIRDGMKLALGI